jgi:hypothetical protein
MAISPQKARPTAIRWLAMPPETHLLASWVIAAYATDNQRDCRLVALAGILPDADGLGIIVDAASAALGHKATHFSTRSIIITSCTERSAQC